MVHGSRTTGIITAADLPTDRTEEMATMARYTTTIRTPRPPAEVFAQLADFRRAVEWDPGVRRVVQVEGDGHGPGAVFDVTIANPGRDFVLRYRTIEHVAPTTVRFVATSRLFTSDDVITVTPDGDGSLVVYDARLSLNGLLGLADPLLGLTFGRIGDRAARGLRRMLDGHDAG